LRRKNKKKEARTISNNYNKKQ